MCNIQVVVQPARMIVSKIFVLHCELVELLNELIMLSILYEIDVIMFLLQNVLMNRSCFPRFILLSCIFSMGCVVAGILGLDPTRMSIKTICEICTNLTRTF